jgi:chemotaxis protein histidine kinase CheA
MLDSLLAELRSATEEQLADLLSALNRGMAVYDARTGPSEKTPAKKPAAAAAGRPKKEPLPAPPKPEDSEEAPDAADYRLDPSDIKEDVCVGRVLKGNEDKRWSPAVYSESQCGAEVEEDGLCKTCLARSQRFAADPKPGRWDGRITEDPLPWQHMLGTAWAVQALASGKLKWLGGAAAPTGGAGTDSASVSSGSDSTASGKMSVAEAKAAAKVAKEAEKAAAAAKKAADKEAAKAAKEAEKAAAKALKEAEKAAAKAAKEAEKASKAATKPATKAAAAPKKAAAASATETVPAKADTSADVIATQGEMQAINGDLRWIVGKKVYEYDFFTNGAGAYVGRLGADGETIDTDIPEEDAAEEESADEE